MNAAAQNGSRTPAICPFQPKHTRGEVYLRGRSCLEAVATDRRGRARIPFSFSPFRPTQKAKVTTKKVAPTRTQLSSRSYLDLPPVLCCITSDLDFPGLRPHLGFFFLQSPPKTQLAITTKSIFRSDYACDRVATHITHYGIPDSKRALPKNKAPPACKFFWPHSTQLHFAAFEKFHVCDHIPWRLLAGGAIDR